MADDFKRNRPEDEACRHCMPKHLKRKASRIARRRLKRELALRELVRLTEELGLYDGTHLVT